MDETWLHLVCHLDYAAVPMTYHAKFFMHTKKHA